MDWNLGYLILTPFLEMAKLNDILNPLINNIICTLLAHSSMPLSFWDHILQMATYLPKILSTKVIGYRSQMQVLYHKNPIFSHLRIFCYLCYPIFLNTTINKLQARSTMCDFLRYPSNHQGYKGNDLWKRKIIILHHVIFYETQFPFLKSTICLQVSMTL